MAERIYHQGGDRFLIIDTGFNHEECLKAMNSSLQKLGVDLNKTDFFITHLHSDHMGLIDRIASDNSKVYFDESEAKWVYAYSANIQEYWEKNSRHLYRQWFCRRCRLVSMMSHPGRKYNSQRQIDFTMLNDGDISKLGISISAALPPRGIPPVI